MPFSNPKPMTESLSAAGVAVDNTAFHFDKLYDYLIPPELQENARPGCRVMIHFGHSLRQGMIMERHPVESAEGLKSVTELLDSTPVLSEELLLLAQDMKERCFCTLFDACKAMLPAGLSLRVTYDYFLPPDAPPSDGLPEEEQRVITYLRTRRVPVRQDRLLKAVELPDDTLLVRMFKNGRLLRSETVHKRLQDKSVKMVTLLQEPPSRRYTPAQNEVLEVLHAVGEVSKKEICYFTGVSGAVVDNLVKKGICAYYDAPPPAPTVTEQTLPEEEIVLTSRQEQVYRELLSEYSSDKPCAALLYGITGSGKTSVFMKLIDRANEENKGVICMVPEIALTPQLLAKFNARYGDRVAVFHSGLSLSKRLEEWRRVKEGRATIAVGTRSAVFAPLQNVGLIVMDEEQEYSYKSSASPRFHARDLAKFRCAYHRGLLVLSSATPAVESYYHAVQGKYSLHTLNSRYGGAQLPHVITVDMNIEQQQGNPSSFSSVLLEALEDNLEQGRQSILLLNRRGHNTFVSCRSCNSVVSCPNCSISLTYHSANRRLMCHYCGYSMPAPERCPDCGSSKLRYAGAGTQKAEQELADIFPQARLLRLDTDSTMQRYAYEKKLGAFQRGEYDIMLGTQMVAKGLDFENVTLVGVLSADQMMHSDDFRSYEKTFSLLTQVVGRSGRGGLEGRAVIQTYEPENPIIGLAAAQDYNAFYDSEIVLRQSMLYPPFSDICVVAFAGAEQVRTRLAAQAFADRMAALVQSDFSELPLRVLGPSPALIARVSNQYRYRMIIKCRNSRRFREMLSRLLTECGKGKAYAGVSVYADMDPDTIL